MFGLGMGEMMLLAVMAVVLFGTTDLPKNLRKMAKGVNDFKKIATDAQRSWAEVRDDVTRTIMQADLDTPAPTPPSTLPPGTSEQEAATVAAAGMATAEASDASTELAPNAEPSLDANAVTPSTADASNADASTASVSEVTTYTTDSASTSPETVANPYPIAVHPAEGARARQAPEAALDHSHDHHEERRAEPAQVAADPQGERKPS